jgi:hypothetical protein
LDLAMRDKNCNYGRDGNNEGHPEKQRVSPRGR